MKCKLHNRRLLALFPQGVGKYRRGGKYLPFCAHEPTHVPVRKNLVSTLGSPRQRACAALRLYKRKTPHPSSHSITPTQTCVSQRIQANPPDSCTCSVSVLLCLIPVFVPTHKYRPPIQKKNLYTYIKIQGALTRKIFDKQPPVRRRNVRNRDRFFYFFGATMKRQVSRAIVSSMTDRRIEGTLITRRTIKRAIRLLCAKFRRNDRTKGNRLQFNEDELRNLNNENLENELRELAMKTRN